MKNTISIMAVSLCLVFGGIVASDVVAQQDNYSVPPTNSPPVTSSSPTPASYLSSPLTNANNSGDIVVPTQTYQTYPSQTYATPANAADGNLVGQTYPGTVTSSPPIVNAEPIVNAQPIYSQPLSYSTPYSLRGSGSVVPGLAQRKANMAARMRLRGHVGGSLGGAKFEGVGWSNVSRQNAIESCCYWGRRATAQIGCTRGPDGYWYACVLYH